MWWLALTALLLSACAGEGIAHTGPEPETVSVARVIDGDSLTVETGAEMLEIRLVGINAPDRGECHHQEARERLAAMVEGAEVTVVAAGIDQFGRQLARVFVEGADIAPELIRGGHGVAVATAPDQHPLVEAEETAHESRLGMWGGECRSSLGSRVGFDPAAANVDPSGPDGNHLDAETVVVVNLGDQAEDLSGWTLRDGSSRHRLRFQPGTVLGPGDRVVVASSDPAWDPGGEPVWSNPGDVALLLDDSGALVARWRYQSSTR